MSRAFAWNSLSQSLG